MTDAPVLFEIDDQIATITLNRPDKLNAMTLEMLADLEAIIAQLEQNIAVRVVLITGAGDRAFCAGADIKEWGALEPLGMWRQWIREGHRVFGRMARLRQPVVAVLNGYTFGGGLELALAADIRLAADRVRVAFPEAKVGIIPGWTGSQRLPRLIGVPRAKQMIFSGAQIEAAKAEQWGLINDVVPNDQLWKAALALANDIAAQAPLSIQVAKQLIDSAVGEGTDFALESLASGMLSHTADGQEGPAAFREKRDPKWQNR